MHYKMTLYIKTYERMHMGGAAKYNSKQKSSVWLPTHLPF